MVDLPEELPNTLRVVHGPELLERIESTQRFGSRLFEFMLSMPKPCLLPHRTSKKERVMIVDRVQLGVLNVSVCVVKPSFIGKQLRQGEMNTR